MNKKAGGMNKLVQKKNENGYINNVFFIRNKFDLFLGN